LRISTTSRSNAGALVVDACAESGTSNLNISPGKAPTIGLAGLGAAIDGGTGAGADEVVVSETTVVAGEVSLGGADTPQAVISNDSNKV